MVCTENRCPSIEFWFISTSNDWKEKGKLADETEKE